MKIRCWNCGTEEANLEASACGFCGELLRPDEAQKVRAVERVDYLIRELKRWKSVPEWWKREAEDNYRKRLFTLRELPQGGELVESEPVREVKPAAPPPLPRAARTRENKAEAIQRLLDAQPYHEPSSEAPVAFEPHAPSEADVAMQMLMGAFSEKKIRLLYALGGVLLLASAVGILGSNWEGWGRQAMGLLLTLLPVLFFWLAGQLKEKLPVSSRMFTVLGGAMLPVGIIFLNIFNAPGELWNPLAFLIGWWVNRKNAEEPICTYLSGLCWALAGWTTGSGLTLGLFSFAGAGLLFWKERENPHWTRVGHGLAFLGLLSAFTAGRLHTGPAMTLFLLAIVYFTTSALVLNTTRAMIGSTLICLLCAGWMGAQLEWPASTVGLAALLQGALYIRRGPTGQALAIYLTGAVMLLFLGLPLLVNHQANLTQFITGTLGAIFYGVASYHYRRPNWAYGASLCSLYAYFCLLSLMQTPAYRPWLIAMMLGWQLAVTLLRSRVPQDYLRPWAFTAAGTALLLVPMNAVLQATGGDAYTPWIYLGVSAVIALCAHLRTRVQGPLRLHRDRRPGLRHLAARGLRSQRPTQFGIGLHRLRGRSGSAGSGPPQNRLRHSRAGQRRHRRLGLLDDAALLPGHRLLVFGHRRPGLLRHRLRLAQTANHQPAGGTLPDYRNLLYRPHGPAGPDRRTRRLRRRHLRQRLPGSGAPVERRPGCARPDVFQDGARLALGGQRRPHG